MRVFVVHITNSSLFLETDNISFLYDFHVTEANGYSCYRVRKHKLLQYSLDLSNSSGDVIAHCTEKKVY